MKKHTNKMPEDKTSFLTYFDKYTHETLGPGCLLSLFLPYDMLKQVMEKDDIRHVLADLRDRLNTLTIYFQRRDAEDLLAEIEKELGGKKENVCD